MLHRFVVKIRFFLGETKKICFIFVDVYILVCGIYNAIVYLFCYKCIGEIFILLTQKRKTKKNHFGIKEEKSSQTVSIKKNRLKKKKKQKNNNCKSCNVFGCLTDF